MTTAVGTQADFGYQWALYPEILPFHQEQFRKWIAPFDEANFAGKTFLDVGCGAGRNAHWAMVAGATGGLAIDYDDRTIASAKHNLDKYPGLEVRFESIYELPEKETFDIAFSIGVIHHLAEPKKAVAKMVEALKPGGSLVLWVYGHEGNELLLAVLKPLRAITMRLPPQVVQFLAKCLTVPLLGFLRLPHKLPYWLMLRRMNFRQLELIVHDQLVPSIAFYWKQHEVRDLVATLPVENVTLAHTNGMSWTLTATKQA